MTRFLLILFCACFYLPGGASAADSGITVSVTGVGPSIDAAKADAIRNALQLALKQLIVVDRAISGDKLIRDKIMSTMNGYVDSYTQKDIQRTATGFTIDAEITVSPTRIENFIGVVVGGGGSFAGSDLQRQRDLRKAQKEAATLQAQSRGEIFDRLFRGFPSAAMDLKVTGIGLAPDDENTVLVNVEISYKPTFLRALMATVQTLTEIKCAQMPRDQNFYELRIVAEHSYADQQCKLEGVGGFGEPPDTHDVACFAQDDIVQCYALAEGDYCAACALQDLAADDAYTPKAILILGRFIDAMGASAHLQGSCFASVAIPQGHSRGGEIDGTFITHRNLQNGKSRLIAGFDLDTKSATLKFSADSISLDRAKYFVGVVGLAPDTDADWNNPTSVRWVNDLVPDAQGKVRGDCDLVDEAVQRFLISHQSMSAKAKPAASPKG